MMAGLRILVCGGRDFHDRGLFEAAMQPYEARASVIISGGAPGADTIAIQWANGFGIPVRVYPADWDAHGRAAGPIRNKRMLEEGRPDLVIAFHGSKGTANMITQAKAAGVEVVEIK